ncbi:triple tyrosine motif-containing protein [Croceivirga thetidis]|uniref:LuxR family transcriptional regulator n=1 Tax=Croceivirga thetidis TaxID=2721623 RepID=A0ABX1GTW7_9FLAO|nr:triple tyrosine motif-containing protein [Croceivirga thetidis]NKI33064.1 LuxR family transcriptional regulator [Croceivirga thetidis]
MRLLTVLICVITINTVAVSQEIPPINYFTPIDYNGENQNWSISQSNDRLIYIANNEGLLEFNGADWSLYKTPNQTTIRSVEVVGDRIYTGCYREFGYWQKNEFGILDYKSLSQDFSQQLEDEEFWNILHVEDFVLFQSKKRIYTYDLKEQSLTTIEANSSFPRMWYVDGQIYFHITNKGLFKLNQGKKTKVYDFTPFIDDEVISLFELQDDLIVLSRHQGFFKISDDTLKPWNTNVDGILSQATVYSAIQLANKQIAIGTVSAGYLLINEEGNLIYQINEKNGLQNNTVLSLHEDFDGNIWLGQDYGLSCINTKAPFKIFNGIQGNVGSVYTASEFDGRLFLGTNQGLYVREKENDAGFQLIEGTQGQVWSLENINGELFCGHHTGTFIIEDVNARRISSIPGTWTFKSMKNQTRILQGNYDGLYVLEKKEDVWRVRNKVKGFDNSARFIEYWDNQIFVNHEYKGVFRIETDTDLTKALQINVDTTIRGHNSGLAKYKNEIIYTYKEGVFKYDSRLKEFKKDTSLSKVFIEEEYVSGKMISNGDRLWFFAKSHLASVNSGNLSNNPIIEKIPLSEELHNNIAGYENITNLNKKGHYILSSGSGYLTMKLDGQKQKPHLIQIGKIEEISETDPDEIKNRLSLEGPVQLSKNQNNINFSVFTAQYNKHDKPLYQYRLLGLYPNWSELSDQSSISFKNLPYGEFEFETRSMVGKTFSENIASYSFTIRKPWFASTVAQIAYVICGILGFLLLHSSYRRYYRRKQEKLISKTQREMQLEKAKNERELIRLKNEQLNQRYKMKSNELAASTMSLIRKNNVLTEVKNLLKEKFDDEGELEGVYDIIDNSLNRNDDWELFQEAFNNADRKFLKKLKNAHPKLTPNDIRLCAYLRLNLSSKEIAPLFNISPRSVEIKRYRLRKKMNLSHDENLTDYILDL